MALVDRDKMASIGVLMQAHGLKGELKARSLTDDPAWYAKHCRDLFLETPGGLIAHKVKAMRCRGEGWVISLEGIETREQAALLKGAKLLLEEQALKPLEAGEYFIDSLIGCEVETVSGETLGKVTGIIETGANNVMEVDNQAGPLLIPLTPQVVKEIQGQGLNGASRIVIDPLPGLLELNRKERPAKKNKRSNGTLAP